MLTVHNLSHAFKDLKVLTDINLTFEKGSKTAIIGPSGSGKSTLLRCLNHLVIPIQGTVTYQDTRVEETTLQSIRPKMAMVFQGFELFSHMTVLKNVTYALEVVHHVEKNAASQKAIASLKEVGLEDKVDAYPAQLSGGQKQRVAIARALATDPEMILFDEPTSALDPEMVSEVLQTIESLKDKAVTIILVTHEIGFAKVMADRMIFMKEGKVEVDTDTPAFFKSQHPALTQFLSKIYHA